MVQNEIFKSAVFLLDHVHHWILLLINYSEKASEQFKNRAWILASYETYSSQDTASTTAVVEVAVAICLNSLLCGTTAADVINTPCPGYKTLTRRYTIAGISESKYKTYPEATYG